MIEIHSAHDLFYHVDVGNVRLYPDKKCTCIQTQLTHNLMLQDIVRNDGEWIPMWVAKYEDKDGLQMTFGEME